MPVTKENLPNVIRYHKSSEMQLAMIGKVRDASENLIEVILASTPACADQTAAIRKVREAMMTSNAAIVLDGLV